MRTATGQSLPERVPNCYRRDFQRMLRILEWPMSDVLHDATFSSDTWSVGDLR